MAKVKLNASKTVVEFKCPGCGWTHMLNLDPSQRPKWEFNGDVNAPTITPSINAWASVGMDCIEKRCHSFVTNGRIKFLEDCTHLLACQEIDLPDQYPEQM